MRAYAPWRDRRQLMAGLGVMLALVGYLALRSHQTVNTVMSPKLVAISTSSQQAELIGAELKSVPDRDDQVAAATFEGRFRNPFVVRPVQHPMEELPEPVAAKIDSVLPPHLAALIYDDIGPTVQIRIEGERSDWLRAGDRFKGWQVAKIDSKSVKISKGGKDVVLR